MALLRRLISTVFARSFLRHTAASSLSRETINAVLLPPRTGFTSRRNYSDKKLLDAVNSEIERTLVSNQQYKDVVDPPEDFPFEIKELSRSNKVRLEREYKGDTISVEVKMVDRDVPVDSSLLRLLVKVNTVDSKMEFICTAQPNKITIDSWRMDSPSFCHFPDFRDMDKNLQEGFHEYLEVRGINMSTANFLRQYVTNYLTMCKNNRVYLSSLKGLKHLFIRP